MNRLLCALGLILGLSACDQMTDRPSGLRTDIAKNVTYMPTRAGCLVAYQDVYRFALTEVHMSCTEVRELLWDGTNEVD